MVTMMSFDGGDGEADINQYNDVGDGTEWSIRMIEMRMKRMVMTIMGC